MSCESEKSPLKQELENVHGTWCSTSMFAQQQGDWMEVHCVSVSISNHQGSLMSGCISIPEGSARAIESQAYPDRAYFWGSTFGLYGVATRLPNIPSCSPSSPRRRDSSLDFVARHLDSSACNSLKLELEDVGMQRLGRRRLTCNPPLQTQ